MNTSDKKDEPKKPARDPVAEMDAAVRKAEEAARRLRRAEDGPLGTFGDEEPLFPDEEDEAGEAPKRRA